MFLLFHLYYDLQQLKVICSEKKLKSEVYECEALTRKAHVGSILNKAIMNIFEHFLKYVHTLSIDYILGSEIAWSTNRLGLQ